MRRLGMIGRPWIRRDLGTHLSLVGHPLHASSIEQTNILMPIELQNPQGPGGKPIVVVSIENNSGLIAHTRSSQQLLQVILAQGRTYNLVLQLFLPVKAHSTRNVALIV